MSWEATTYVSGLDACLDGAPLSRGQKLVLFVLADHHNRAFRAAWPSIPRLAHEALASLATTKRDLAYLEKHGMIRKLPPKTYGRGWVNAYEFPALDSEKAAQNDPLSRPGQSRSKDVRRSQETSSEQAQNRLTHVGAIRKNPEHEPDKEQERERPPNNIRLSQSERDTWDLRRWQEEMKRLKSAVGVYETDPDATWRARARAAAFAAGLSPERIVALLKQHFPSDHSVVALLYEGDNE